jgi:hypothetical protein
VVFLLSPAYPEQRTLVGVAGMSQSCQERTHALQQKAPLFDHLVGASEQRWRADIDRLI